LERLLNCANVEAHLPLDKFPYVKKSVINFGLPSFSGAQLKESDLETVALAIKEAITNFETRILQNSIDVKIVKSSDSNKYNKSLFRIQAALWFEPYPIDLVVRAQWDTEDGSVRIQEISS
jgi:type VI secretion system protein ImpF